MSKDKKIVKRTKQESKTVTTEYDDGSVEIVITTSKSVPCGDENNPC